MKLSIFCILALLCLGLAGQAFAQTTTDADSYRKAGAAYFKAGQFRESVQAYQQVIRLKPNDTAAYDQLGEAFTRLGMNKEAAAAFEKEADLLLSGNTAPAAAPTPAVTQTAQNRTPQAQPRPSAAIGQHKVGERVDYVDNGVWFKAIIILVRDDSADHLDGKIYAPYRVHPLGYNLLTDRWVCCLDFTDRRSQLSPAGSKPTEPIPGGEANDEVLKAMRGDPTAAVTPSPAYGYVARTIPEVSRATPPASRTTPAAKQYDCQVGEPITITGNGTYNGGTYSFDSATSILTFRGGVYDGQRAQYETSYGLAQLHILGPSGRPVIDCD
jgi:TPR repeat